MLETFMFAAEPFGTWGPGPVPEPVGYWAKILGSVVNDPRAVATIIAAFLGFVVGVLFKYWLDRRADRIRRKTDRRILAIALRAELLSLQDDAIRTIKYVNSLRAATGPVMVGYVAQVAVPPKPVYGGTTDRVGDLGAQTALAVVKAHATAIRIRTIVAALCTNPFDWDVGATWLASLHNHLLLLLERSLEAVNALDRFLGEPPQYPDPQAILDEYAPAQPAEPDPEKSSE